MITSTFLNALRSREEGSLHLKELNQLKIWSKGVFSIQNIDVQLISSLGQIVFMDSKENLIIFMTSNGLAFIYNELLKGNAKQINTPLERFFKFSFSGPSIFSISQVDTDQMLKFSLIETKDSLSFPRHAILQDLQLLLNDISEFDTTHSNLIILKQGCLKVVKVPEGTIIFQSNTICPYYTKNNIISYPTIGNTEILVRDLSTGNAVRFQSPKTKKILLFDYFFDFMIVVFADSLTYVDLMDGKAVEIEKKPNSYYIGRANSVAQYSGFVMIMNKRFTRVFIEPVMICADLREIIVAVEKNLRNIVIFDTQGYTRQNLRMEFNVIYVCINLEADQVILAGKNKILGFQ